MSRDQNTLAELRIDRTGAEPGGRRWPLILVVALLLVAAAAYAYMRRQTVSVRAQVVRDAAVGGNSRTVLNASGYVVARRQATVSSKITGKVVEVLIEEGMKVESGQVLARVDDTNIKASLQLAEAELAAARAARGETRARLDEAEKEWQRVSTLTTNQIASFSDHDKAEAEVKSLKARLELQEVQVSVAEKQLAVWKQQLEDTVIRAPFAGIAVSKNAQPGEMISPVSAGGGFTRTGIGTVVDMSSLEIEVDVNESFINRVRPRQAVEAVLDAYPDWTIMCQVIAIIPTADRQKATVKVRVSFDQLDPRILPDMGAKVAFLGAADTPGTGREWLVPKAALRKEGGHDVVWVLKNDRLECRTISSSGTRGNDTVVTSGLSMGDRVVVEGPARLTEGARVREKK